MDLQRSLRAYLSLSAGAIAAAIGTIWLVTGGHFGLRNSEDLPETLADFGSQIRIRLMAVGFELLLPLAGVLALIFGLSNWRHPASQLGLMCSVFALTVYFYVVQDALEYFLR